MTLLDSNKIYQGTELEKGKSFVAIVCDIDDIKERAEQKKIKLTKKELEQAYELTKHKMTDLLMDDFWYTIDAMFNEIEWNKEN